MTYRKHRNHINRVFSRLVTLYGQVNQVKLTLCLYINHTLNLYIQPWHSVLVIIL